MLIWRLWNYILGYVIIIVEGYFWKNLLIYVPIGRLDYGI